MFLVENRIQMEDEKIILSSFGLNRKRLSEKICIHIINHWKYIFWFECLSNKYSCLIDCMPFQLMCHINYNQAIIEDALTLNTLLPVKNSEISIS